MTRDEFVQKRKALGRETPTKFDSLVALAVVVLGGLGLPISKHFSEQIALVYFGLLFVLCVAFLIYALRWARRTGLLCHSCHRPMLRQAADMALASGICPYCKKAAFESKS